VPSSGRRRRAPRLITLSSDVGAAYAAQMKAVLVDRRPPGTVIDLTHDLRPHDVVEAAFLVRAMAERFPAGTVHLVVVDPGVGGSRAPVAIRCRDGSFLVGPDNGVLLPLAEALGGGEAYRIDPGRLASRPRVGTTFDGRDLFAPAAARLASGLPPHRLGERVSLRGAAPPAPQRTAEGARGIVVHVDRFGNIVTNVPSGWLPGGIVRARTRCGRTARPVAVVTSYESGRRGELLLLRSSFGTLELAVRRARAADRVRVGTGDPVAFAWPRRPRRSRRKRKKPPT